MRTFPALEVTWPGDHDESIVDHLIAMLDDTEPTAVEERPAGVRIFFAVDAHRDVAAGIARALLPTATVTTLLVPDDNWAERSQAALEPVRVGGLIVAPPWAMARAAAEARIAGDTPTIISIQPSMGFGTGHHQSTRLCLALLQQFPPQGGRMLDIGTGSGVLAIAAWRLGARQALGIDFDRDALASAAENVAANEAGEAVALDTVDITRDAGRLAGRFDVVCANITGAVLIRHAVAVASPLAGGAVLVASGFQTHELEDVHLAFRACGLSMITSVDESSWVAAAFRNG